METELLHHFEAAHRIDIPLLTHVGENTRSTADSTHRAASLCRIASTVSEFKAIQVPDEASVLVAASISVSKLLDLCYHGRAEESSERKMDQLFLLARSNEPTSRRNLIAAEGR